MTLPFSFSSSDCQYSRYLVTCAPFRATGRRGKNYFSVLCAPQGGCKYLFFCALCGRVRGIRKVTTFHEISGWNFRLFWLFCVEKCEKFASFRKVTSFHEISGWNFRLFWLFWLKSRNPVYIWILYVYICYINVFYI